MSRIKQTVATARTVIKIAFLITLATMSIGSPRTIADDGLIGGTGQEVVTSQGAIAAATAKLAGAKPFRDGDYVVDWIATAPKLLAPGQTGAFYFTAVPDNEFFVYASVVDDSQSSTNFVITKKSGLKFGAPVSDEKVYTKTIAAGFPKQRFHKGAVSWLLPVTAPTQPGTYQLEGFVGYQACMKKSCRRPKGFKFTANIVVAGAPGSPSHNAGAQSLTMMTASYAEVMDAAASTNWVDDPAVAPGESTADRNAATALSR